MITATGSIAKQARQALITEAIRNGRVSTQAELLDALRRAQMLVNQSTLSRDLAELGIRKSGGHYALAESLDEDNPRLNVAPAVRRFTTCGPHMVVLTTGQGQAQPVALAIDEARDPVIVGTVAGDDTVFIATKNRRTQAVALRRLTQWFGDKHEH